MTAHNPTPTDPQPDDDLTALLRDAVDGESPRDEFVADLADRLEVELQSVLADNGQAVERQRAAAEQSGAVTERRSSRRNGRSLIALATAVVLVLSVMVWTARPSYSWASMLQAMESQPWIQSDSGMALDSGNSDSFEHRLVSFLLSGASKADIAGSLEAVTDIAVLDQSWRSVEDEFNRWVELDVTLGLEAVIPSQVHLMLHLDPKSQLPQKCSVVSDESQLAATVGFEYVRRVPQHASVVAISENPLSETDTGNDEKVQIVMADLEIAPDGVASESVVDAEELPLNEAPPTPVSSDEMKQQVDRLMAAYWDRQGVSPSAGCEDDEFFRRVYLDLTGRIPTVSEYREFQTDTEDDRRGRLIEQLLARRDHATHLGAVWRKILLPDGVDLTDYGGPSSFEEWLSERFRENMPYDELVHELLLAEGRVSEAGPILFYTALNLEPEEIAAQTARAFLGIRLECAQCHDHFFDNRLKQTDFWGFAAFFAQISQPTGKMDMVSPVLRIADTDHGEVTLPETEDIVAPQYPLEDSSLTDSDDASRRQQLVAWMTANDNPHFARATVNRVWAHLFGRGLVEPVDDMRIDNPSLCPEVLNELADYFVATGFDLRNLFRVLVNSETYQQTSQSADGSVDQATHFAQMNIKTFTAEQLYDSIAVATRLQETEYTDGSVMRFQNGGRQAFLDQFKAPPGQVTDYQAGIPQALTLMNGGLIQSATGLKSSGVLRSLQAPFFTDEQRVDTLFIATMSRQPEADERQAMLDYVLSDDGERNQRLTDVLWALVNSAEFTLNH